MTVDGYSLVTVFTVLFKGGIMAEKNPPEYDILLGGLFSKETEKNVFFNS